MKNKRKTSEEAAVAEEEERNTTGEMKKRRVLPQMEYDPVPENQNNSIEEALFGDIWERYQLSSSQKRVLEAIMQRKSVFYTGAAGTGKSFILKVLLDVVELLNLSSKVAITAPTGVAACNIHGLTIHSWSGIGLGNGSLGHLISMVAKNCFATQRWKDVEILIIDEISMLPGELFGKLDKIGRMIRNNSNPFGGIQVILCGDFFQLPPIGLGKNGSLAIELFPDYPNSFEVPTISCQKSPKGEIILLEKVFRQQGDLTFLNLLNALRRGQVPPFAREILMKKVHQSQLLKQQEVREEQQLQQPLKSFNSLKSEIRPTKLFSTNNDVDHHNLGELQRLQDENGNDSITYTVIHEVKDLGALKSQRKSSPILILCIGARVMLLTNLNTEIGLVNGARGTVIGFQEIKIPSYYYPKLPIVKFQLMVGGFHSEKVVTITPDTWSIRLGDRIQVSRIQIPLKLAWAISIHKAQGMTFSHLEVSFNRIFEYGQAYVALSRVTSLEGLDLTDFSVKAVRAHPKVVAFYEHLQQRQYTGYEILQYYHQQKEEEIIEVSLRDLVRQFQSVEPFRDVVEIKECDPNVSDQELIDQFIDEENEMEKEEDQEDPLTAVASPMNRPNSSPSFRRSVDLYGNVSTPTTNSLISSPIPDDLRRKIEENRQQALRKLAHFRQQQEEVKKKLSLPSSFSPSSPVFYHTSSV